ncbi:hypothetical protein BDV96DRAFT_652434 [Lophiotrema nucula]|uniref:Mid2 domain-containing protein n=1 Tax=Lophiotrema nucula TaxID=690887 RepID=A0A6A5YRN8_9PLEO|nr:hypothetical protein BDV96DRAFT_652434 [Lophiotrema nucula]
MDFDELSRYLLTTGLTATGSLSTFTTGRYSNHTRAHTLHSTVQTRTSTSIISSSSTAGRPTFPIITRSTLVTSTSTPTSPSQLPPTPTSFTADSQRLSSTTAMGVGVSIGVASIVSIVCLGLLLYRYKRRQTPEYQHYQQAKLWKGFTPQKRSSQLSTTSTVDEKLQHVYVAELPVPPSPLIVISPALSSGSRSSWHSPLPSPFTPPARPRPFIELPI